MAFEAMEDDFVFVFACIIDSGAVEILFCLFTATDAIEMKGRSGDGGVELAGIAESKKKYILILAEIIITSPMVGLPLRDASVGRYCFGRSLMKSADASL